MRKLYVVIAFLGVLACPAAATAAVVDVRIEGKSSTLFEGPVNVGARNVQSLSERATGAIRKCDGTNGGASPTPGATATSAAVDAMSISGQGFDGKWYDDFDDYLINRFGGEHSASWSLNVDGTFAPVGGCQTKPSGRVTWLPTGEGPLSLQPVGASVNVPQVTIKANVANAMVYIAGADGGVAQELGTTGDANTNYAVTLPPAGWQRIKVRVGNRRSNRVEACASACEGTKPPDLLPRTPPAPVFYGPGGALLPRGQSQALTTTTTPFRISRPVAGASGYRMGRIAVRWRVTQKGVGLLRWRIASRDLTAKRTSYVTRARGTTATSALLALPVGRVYALRYTGTDRMLRDTDVDFGGVLVPLDDRAKGVRRAGLWRKVRASGAWKGTALRGHRGSRIKVRLAGGQPAVVLRGRRGKATLRIGSKRVRIPARKAGSRVVVYGPTRKRTGTVKVSVLSGTVDLDGVAASP